jgi:NAD(P)-dependent dehydrogenase (short-subunit alcohol dehydrogenase family)
MTRGIATALGEFNINANAVASGLVMTEAMQTAFSEDVVK